jgi:uncharacterized membrane protein (UPF0127 family)
MRVFISVTLALGLLNQTANATTLPTVPLQIGLYVVQAEVAADDESRIRGLMYRTEMAQNKGMLFIFDRLGVQCFWMKKTLIPLTAAFLDDNGKIINMADMTPLSSVSHCSKQPVRYVLEMNQSWFKTRGLKEGTVVKGLP